MRSSNKSRSRNKNNNRRTNNVGNVVNRVFDSAGPEGKVRGTPQQIIEKYQALFRDAQLSGDRVAAENFQQHAEHYTRLLSEAQREINERRDAQQAQQQQNNNNGQNANNNNNQQNNGSGQQPQVQSEHSQPQQSEKRDEPKSSSMMPQLPVNDGSEPQPEVGDSGLTTFGDQPQEPVELVQTPESNPPKPKRAPRKRTPRKAAPKADAVSDDAPAAES